MFSELLEFYSWAIVEAISLSYIEWKSTGFNIQLLQDSNFRIVFGLGYFRGCNM